MPASPPCGAKHMLRLPVAKPLNLQGFTVLHPESVGQPTLREQLPCSAPRLILRNLVQARSMLRPLPARWPTIPAPPFTFKII